jgi:RimJ/RimL family protein N-acetyltransferase
VPTVVLPVVHISVLAGQSQLSLTADDIELRPWSDRDSAFLVTAYSDLQIQRWHVRTIDAAEAPAWIEERALRWTSERGADWVMSRHGIPVGRVGLRTIDLQEGRAEVAFKTVADARGKGAVVKALGILSTWALDTVGFHRLDLHRAVAKDASWRVAVKCG